jgi:hypothetical protein
MHPQHSSPPLPTSQALIAPSENTKHTGRPLYKPLQLEPELEKLAGRHGEMVRVKKKKI